MIVCDDKLQPALFPAIALRNICVIFLHNHEGAKINHNYMCSQYDECIINGEWICHIDEQHISRNGREIKFIDIVVQQSGSSFRKKARQEGLLTSF